MEAAFRPRKESARAHVCRLVESVRPPLPTHSLSRGLTVDRFASLVLSVVRTTFANSAAKHDTAALFARVGEAEFDALFKSVWGMYNSGASWQLYPETLSVLTVRALRVDECVRRTHNTHEAHAKTRTRGHVFAHS